MVYHITSTSFGTEFQSITSCTRKERRKTSRKRIPTPVEKRGTSKPAPTRSKLNPIISDLIKKQERKEGEQSEAPRKFAWAQGPAENSWVLYSKQTGRSAPERRLSMRKQYSKSVRVRFGLWPECSQS
eukprot:s1444_g4.t1